MALTISSINSGSNGNCYYIGNETDAVLVDAGISCRETVKRMLHQGLCINKVRAIFISHEHSDHIKAVGQLSTRYNLPVYISKGTYLASRLKLDKLLIKDLSPELPVTVGEIEVTSFLKRHDAADPQSFTIRYKGTCIGVFTDIGSACEKLKFHFSQCHAAFLESNYDEAMLENGKYPLYLKNRIRGGLGHLSNTQALEIFKLHKPAFMTHLLLAHLSKDNNDPSLAKKLFENHAGNTEIIVASRYFATLPLLINNNNLLNNVVKKQQSVSKQKQLSLF